MGAGVVVVAVNCVEVNVYGGVMIFFPMGVLLDTIDGNEVIVVEVTDVVPDADTPEARVITLAPNTFQLNSQVLFSLTVLGFAERLSTTGKRVE